MVKQKKKRNKVYKGADASITRPVITHVQAVKRHPIHQWWVEKKRIAKPVIIAVVVAAIVIWLVVEFIRVLNGGT